MSKLATIKVKGKEYPCYQTGGGLLRFRERRGKEASDIDLGDMRDLSEALFCFTKSACRREEVEFPYGDCQDFMDDVLMEDITAWAKSQGETTEAEEDDEKKRVRES